MQCGSILDCLSCFLFTYVPEYTHSKMGASPAELLIWHRLHSPLDLVKPDLECRVVNEQLTQMRGHDGDAHAREFELDKQSLPEIWDKVLSVETGSCKQYSSFENMGRFAGRFGSRAFVTCLQAVSGYPPLSQPRLVPCPIM